MAGAIRGLCGSIRSEGLEPENPWKGHSSNPATVVVVGETHPVAIQAEGVTTEVDGIHRAAMITALAGAVATTTVEGVVVATTTVEDVVVATTTVEDVVVATTTAGEVAVATTTAGEVAVATTTAGEVAVATTTAGEVVVGAVRAMPSNEGSATEAIAVVSHTIVEVAAEDVAVATLTVEEATGDDHGARTTTTTGEEVGQETSVLAKQLMRN
eukprot:g7796.t1